jgi:hypothetical protein
VCDFSVFKLGVLNAVIAKDTAPSAKDKSKSESKKSDEIKKGTGKPSQDTPQQAQPQPNAKAKPATDADGDMIFSYTPQTAFARGPGSMRHKTDKLATGEPKLLREMLQRDVEPLLPAKKGTPTRVGTGESPLSALPARSASESSAAPAKRGRRARQRVLALDEFNEMTSANATDTAPASEEIGTEGAGKQGVAPATPPKKAAPL